MLAVLSQAQYERRHERSQTGENELFQRHSVKLCAVASRFISS